MISLWGMKRLTTELRIRSHWSVRSMGKAIDALHDAMIEIIADGSKFLDEDFMNNIFF